MGHKLAVDFGTTNSVLARWDEETGRAEIVAIPGLSAGGRDARRPLIPSLLYVADGRAGQVTIGQAVLDGGLDRQRTHRLFRNFKRGIAAGPLPEPRLIDGVPWTDRDAGRHFLRALLGALPFAADEIEELAVTVPVTAFESYTAWLAEALPPDLAERIRLVDESTAAALGYAVTRPGEVVLVVDLGGGTLDLSLVRLPESRHKAGARLGRLLGAGGRGQAARVVAKAGASLGGSDVDQWLLAEVLSRAGLSPRELGAGYAPLLAACERAKIDLSTVEAAEVSFETDDGRRFSLTLRRAELESLMTERGFFSGLRQAVDQALGAAHRQGIYREDVGHVLLVGGVSLTPSVQQLLIDYFGEEVVRVERPFTAVAEGALQVAIGYGLEDHLTHSYGLRYLDPQTGAHAYDEVIPEGSRYPTAKPVEIVLGAAHPDQRAVEFVIGQIDSRAVSMVEVQYQAGQAVFVAQADRNEQQVRALNRAGARTVELAPPGRPGEDRLRAAFRVDELRRLRLTVTDLKSGQRLLRDAVVATLGGGEGGEADDAAAEAGREQLTGREPSLAAYARPGRVRLSLRGVASMLNLLPPESISLEAAAEALRSPDCTVRYSAAEMLSKRGDRDARRILQDVLDKGSPPQRASAARHLHRLSWFGAEPLLRRALVDEDERVHESAIFALCKMRSREAYDLACQILPGEGDGVRLEAAWTLKDSRDPRAVPLLEIALQAQAPRVREVALEALGGTEAAEALPVVRRALDDADPGVIYAAALSLVELAGEEAFPEFAALIEGAAGRQRRAIVQGFFHATNYLFIDVAASPGAGAILAALEAALGDQAAETRLAAAMPLARMDDAGAAALLKAAFRREPDGETRARILYYAVLLESPAGHELLPEALHCPDEAVRDTARDLAEYLEYKAGLDQAEGGPAGDRAPLVDAAGVTPAWLTEVLRAGGHLPRGDVVAVRHATYDDQAGGGPGFTPQNVLAVEYTAGAPASAPGRLYLKVGGGGPHKQAGRQEIDFYTRVAPQMPVSLAVACYDAAYDPETGRYHLLLADVSASHWVLHPEGPVGQDEAAQMLDALARLHAYWWDHMWLGAGVGRRPTAASIRAEFERLAGAFGGYVDFLGDRLPAGGRSAYEWLLAEYPALLEARLVGAGDLTLVHNDAHAGNLLLPRDPDQQPVYLADWQQWGVGLGPADAAYLIALFWPADRRAELEEPLVRAYHGRLRAYGGLAYDWDACWRDYRLGAVGNLLVPFWAWLDGTWTAKTEPHRWGQVARAIAAFQDLGCQGLGG